MSTRQVNPRRGPIACVLALLTASSVLAGCTEEEVPPGGYTPPGPTSTLPDNQAKVQSGTQARLDGFDVRPSVYTDGEVVVEVVSRSEAKTKPPNTEWSGEVLTGYEGDEFDAYGRTFTFVEVDPDPMAGSVVIAIDEGG